MFTGQGGGDREDHHQLHEPWGLAEGAELDLEKTYADKGSDREAHEEQIEKQRRHDEEAEELEDSQRKEHRRGGKKEQSRCHPGRGKRAFTPRGAISYFLYVFHNEKKPI